MRFKRPRGARVLIAAGLLAVSSATVLIGNAASQESLDDLKSRMSDIQGQLDAATAKIEDLRTREDKLKSRLGEVSQRIDDVTKDQRRLEKRVVEAAKNLYKSGGADMLETLLTAESFSELSSRAQVLNRISQRDTEAFIAYARNQSELKDLTAELEEREGELSSTRQALNEEADRLQATFEGVSAEYNDLKKKLAARAAAREAAAAAAAPAPTSSAPSDAPIHVPATNGMACPVAGAVSFIDSWGYPRSGGRLHQGVDMMAAYGTPVVAITSGNITYAGYGGSAGNWLILSGDDGHGYWYMHNQSNIVTSGHVSAGQQIATVGDTGNAVGTPHLHFEYHPGGGGAVNPYPLVASIC
ncbi:MAG TPA: peptidoglycan DD-metalloendopeptidase family protein [Actinomycetota bacterium]|nr:peptidoglycan DD-metalloendopeptidase family protein [Actinomycetota bacterium]